jgi:hypothetical protein
MAFDVPILFIVFNRPDTTRRVFQKIREIQPERLFIAADGPRIGIEGDEEKCETVRNLVMEGIDWPCEVITLFRDQNLGCGLAVSGAITWFFENVEEGIILEDDTVPDSSFFNYCKTLLEIYRDDPRIMLISGDNFQDGQWRGKASYYFSAYNHIWGWASWKRAWKYYDYTLAGFTEESFKEILKKYFSEKFEHDYWFKNFRRVKEHAMATWDFQWTFSIWEAGGMSILPNVNLVTNIGFGEDATHTTNVDSDLAGMKINSLTEILHPKKIEINKLADKYTSIKIFKTESRFIKEVKRKIRRFFYG